MTETNTPGQYVGTYTVRRGDQVIGDRLTAHLTVNGATFTEKATAPVTIVTKTAMKPVIESPAPNSRVGQEMTVTGRADPGSDVEITVTYQQTLLGILGTRGTIATERAKVDAAGQFRSPAIPLGGLFGTDGVHYTVQVVEIDAAGQRSEPAVVEVHG